MKELKGPVEKTKQVKTGEKKGEEMMVGFWVSKQKQSQSRSL